MNHWRTIRYTDDGCYLYECLSCKERWEARQAPGYYDQWVDTEVQVEGGWTTTSSGVPHHYAKRAVPVYVPHWRFCPYCGTTWKGPIRCDIDNPYMYGERRKLAYNCDRGGYCNPDYWYCIMVSEGRQPYITSKVDPREHSIIEVHEFVKRKNAEAEPELRWRGNTPEEVKTIYSIRIMKDSAMELRGYVRSEYIR